MEKHRMIQYALNKNDELVYIDDVPNGNNCECHCTFCKEPLNARNGGSINIHHFAHLSGTDCKNAFERTVHLLAKQIIAEEQRIPLFDNNDQPIKIENIEIEKDLGDIRPDLLVTFEGHPIAIEIYVTHAIDDTKYNKIANHKLTTIEINLSSLMKTSKEDIKKALYDKNNTVLIYDYGIMQGYINQKIEIIRRQGTPKQFDNYTFPMCPMKNKSVNIQTCRKCTFSFINEDAKMLYCIGNLNGNIPDWFIRANVHENRFMSLSESCNLMNDFTDGRLFRIHPELRRNKPQKRS